MRISCYNAQFIFANDLVFCVRWVSMLKNTKYGGFQCTSLISHGNTSSLHQNFMNTAENSWFLQPGIRLVFLTIFTLIHYISINYYENFVLDTLRKVFYIIIGIQIAIIHKIIAYKHGRPFLRHFPTLSTITYWMSTAHKMDALVSLAPLASLSKSISICFVFVYVASKFLNIKLRNCGL